MTDISNPRVTLTKRGTQSWKLSPLVRAVATDLRRAVWVLRAEWPQNRCQLCNEKVCGTTGRLGWFSDRSEVVCEQCATIRDRRSRTHSRPDGGR